jgi:hypothetical protein
MGHQSCAVTIITVLLLTLIVAGVNDGNEDARQCAAAEAEAEANNKCLSVAVSPDSTGLEHDAAVLQMYFGSQISSFSEPPPPNCAVWIFLEQTPFFLKSRKKDLSSTTVEEGWYNMEPTTPGTRVWVLVNPDQFFDEILLQPQLELILCKTRQCVKWIQEARIRLKLLLYVPIFYLGFTSIANNNLQQLLLAADAHVEQDFDTFLHVAGKSPFKGSVAVLQAWLNNPQWPKLTVTSHNNMLLNHVFTLYYKTGSRLPHNINHTDKKISSEEFEKVRREHGVHLCPSSMEGFGHSINEARAVGALVISTDYPSMNEFFPGPEDSGGVLVKPSELVAWTNGMKAAQVNASGIEQAVNRVLTMTIKERANMGALAKEAYENDRAAFEGRIETLKCLVSLKTPDLNCRNEPLAKCAEACGVTLE